MVPLPMETKSNFSFVGKRIAEYWWRHDTKDLPLILEWRLAGYDDHEIKQAIRKDFIPSTEEIFLALGQCSRCACFYHIRDQCESVICQGCKNFVHICLCDQLSRRVSLKACNICQSLGHNSMTCPSNFVCIRCWRLGHIKSQCGNKFSKSYYWKAKSTTQGKRPTPQTRSLGRKRIRQVWRPKRKPTEGDTLIYK